MKEIVPNKTKEYTNKRTSGPKSKILQIDGDWEEAVRKAIKKKRPPGGWPK